MTKKILMIDADRPFASAISAQLAARGLDASVCTDGTQGLELVRTERPDVVVLCVELPRVSGYSICNKLKKDEQLRSIPLVMTSAEATPQTFEQHGKLRTRADEYLLKPFDAATLLQTIARLVELPPESFPPDEVIPLEALVPDDGPPAPRPASPDVGADAFAAGDDDDALIDRAFDQLAIGGDGSIALQVEPPRPRPAERGDDGELQQLRSRVAELEQRAAGAEARAAAAEERLRQLEGAREQLAAMLSGALRLMQGGSSTPEST